MGYFGEIREGIAEGERVGCLDEHKGHAGAEKGDVSAVVRGKVFPFKIPRWQGGVSWMHLVMAL